MNRYQPHAHIAVARAHSCACPTARAPTRGPRGCVQPRARRPQALAPRRAPPPGGEPPTPRSMNEVWRTTATVFSAAAILPLLLGQSMLTECCPTAGASFDRLWVCLMACDRSSEATGPRGKVCNDVLYSTLGIAVEQLGRRRPSERPKMLRWEGIREAAALESLRL